jgi:hypothetical protein
MMTGDLPEAERAKLEALQQRCSQLLAMLPTDINDLLDADQLDAKLADIELISAEMMAINAAERAVLDELERR